MITDGIELFVALSLALIELAKHIANRLTASLLQINRQGGVFAGSFGLHLLDASVFEDGFLSLDQLADRFVSEVDRFNHIPFRQLIRPGLNHHHTIGGAGHDQIEISAFDLSEAGVEHKVVAQEANPHRGHRSLERNARQQCCH